MFSVLKRVAAVQAMALAAQTAGSDNGQTAEGKEHVTALRLLPGSRVASFGTALESTKRIVLRGFRTAVLARKLLFDQDLRRHFADMQAGNLLCLQYSDYLDKRADAKVREVHDDETKSMGEIVNLLEKIGAIESDLDELKHQANSICSEQLQNRKISLADYHTFLYKWAVQKAGVEREKIVAKLVALDLPRSEILDTIASMESSAEETESSVSAP